MPKSACLVLGSFLLALISGAQNPTTQQAPAEKAGAGSSGTREALERAVQQYAEAFNKQDAVAAAALWAPEAVYENRQSGERIEGREAIQKDLAELFKERPGLRLAVSVENARLIRPEVAVAEGKSFISRPDQEPEEIAFSAIFVKSDGRWMLNSVQEMAPASPASARAALKQLEWMVGQWRDESEDIRVDTSVRWAPGGSFLIRAYEVQLADDEQPRHGTQVIGWDAARRQIRSWIFESDGSFGEGRWSQSGDEWTVRITFTTADGAEATGTQVLTRVNDDTMKVQMVGQEINGEPLPSGEPVTVARVATGSASR